MTEETPNVRRDSALLQLVVWAAKETEATRNRRQWLIEAKNAGASYQDLGTAMGLSRETARARWAAAVKAAQAEEDEAAKAVQAEEDEAAKAITEAAEPPPAAPVQGATPTIVPGPLPAAVH